MRLRNFIVSGFAVAATLIASAGHSGAMVLCVGLDGHVEIEASIDGVCAGTDSHHAGDDAGHSAALFQSPDGDSDHCGSCVDLPLRSGAEDTCHPVLLPERRDAPAPQVIAALPNEVAPVFDPIPFSTAAEVSNDRDWANGLTPATSVVLVL